MAKKYKIVRMPSEAWDDFSKKRNAIEEVIRKETKKPDNIKLTDILRYFSQKKIYMYNDELLNFFVKRKRKKTEVRMI